eukprot:CAMPEP_0181131232 /NCGR_PEP_ID=MMETSP1071-20121207/30312_1 /TAXON_ID=35127 /ORGANISM="Thalassiosira sp., Strain NH16" /LENGTH=306 /DNA_ID=CAMNT_0023217405 /DNA_START=150 /DNA_END=1070 /DNA_ORIENTATION=+
MMRSNAIARRIASAIPTNYAIPRAASSAMSSSAMDALASSPSASPSSSSTARYYFSPPPPMMTATHRRQFSSSEAATELGSILQREINEETEASTGGIPAELSELRNDVSAKWTILEGIVGIGNENGETGSGATVRMFRKDAGSNGAKIGVVFHCQDTEDDIKFDENDPFAGMGGENGEGGEEGDEEEEPPQAVRFGVTVSKGGRTVVMQCRSGDEGVNVESVMVRDGDTESVLSELAGGEGLHAALYQGPEFTELAEDLQESFRTYVTKECGVDDDVTAFVSMYCDYCEQEEYVSWMKTAIDILD